ncbi:MAG TPA: hypothetical protein VG253_18855 [Streptosporangiaceae bacterium]|jgi:hypothetical protein|nr:hypothetical protein [Streptosporangiaceae bacterium]
MTGDMSRRAVLKGASVAAGAAFGGWALAAGAGTASAATTTVKTARVGASVTVYAYPAGTTWDKAMADFNATVGRNFSVAKRYYGAAHTWPKAGGVGPAIQTLMDRKCRGLLCFKPARDGSDVDALVSALKAIKNAGLTDVKITLYEEQGLAQGLTATEFKQVYAAYQPVRQVFPLFVDFSGHAWKTWADYRPAGIDGIALDYYANSYVAGSRIDILSQWASEAGQELGIWEMGNTAYKTVPTPAEISAYFSYISSVQASRLAKGHRVGDMVWYNGPSGGNYNNTIAGTRLSSLYKLDRKALTGLFDKYNGAL